MATVSGSSLAGMSLTRRDLTSPIPIAWSSQRAILHGSREGRERTGSSKDADDLAGAAAIVGDGNHVAERGAVGFADALKDINEAVGRAAAGEDHDATAGFRVRADGAARRGRRCGKRPGCRVGRRRASGQLQR